MGTGMGRTSYSIMAQGNITQILSSKPDDRRMVFEEAAGITKFKCAEERSAAQAGIHRAESFARPGLIREVKRQIGSLQRQAGKARRYKQIADGTAASRNAARASSVRRVAGGNRRAQQPRRKNCASKMEVCSESVLRGEDEILQLRERLSELEEQIAASQQQGHGTERPDAIATRAAFISTRNACANWSSRTPGR